MSVIKKDWGETRCIFRNETVEVWHASIRAGGKSSVHRHRWKANEFYVLSGTLELHLWVPEWCGYELFQGASQCVGAGYLHQFEAITDVELIETYWLEPIDPDDIQRETTERVIERSINGVRMSEDRNGG